MFIYLVTWVFKYIKNFLYDILLNNIIIILKNFYIKKKINIFKG